MLASIKDDDGGKMAVIIDTGAVSRAGREKAIRAKAVEADLVEAIILLPEKLFYNTGAPGLVIVFNKNKPKERKTGITAKKCERCGRFGAHIKSYGINLCRHCFREVAEEIGFKKYS